jgi:hypothetical protein
MSGNNRILEPTSRKALDELKLEVANETLGRDMKQPITAENYESALDEKKWEAAEDLGLKEMVDAVGWENMTTGEVGKIGGRTGGKIGGGMVKELIARAEDRMAPAADEVVDKNAREAGPGG